MPPPVAYRRCRPLRLIASRAYQAQAAEPIAPIVETIRAAMAIAVPVSILSAHLLSVDTSTLGYPLVAVKGYPKVMTEQPAPSPAVTAIRETIAQLAATPDPIDRAKALGAVLDAIPDLQAELRGERQKAVIEIRESKSIADTAELLDVSQGRISQIAKGISRTKKH